jgi:hypothetical protein
MIDEILKRKRETIEKLKKHNRSDIRGEKSRKETYNRRSKKKRLKRRRKRGRNRSCGSGEANEKRRCMCNIRSNRRGFFR